MAHGTPPKAALKPFRKVSFRPQKNLSGLLQRFPVLEHHPNSKWFITMVSFHPLEDRVVLVPLPNGL